jgi:MraZ protein
MVVNCPMFIGEFEYRVDEKGRVPIPPKFRTDDIRKEGLVLCPGMDNCITIYTPPEWKKLAASLTSSNSSTPFAASKLRKLNRAIFAAAFDVELDGQGRITIPPQLRLIAGINDEVVIAGANTYLELWNKEQWGLEKSRSLEEAWQIIETLERR